MDNYKEIQLSFQTTVVLKPKQVHDTYKRGDFMRIIIIGNGFDLAHDLPTKYGDFLQFIETFIEAFINNDNNVKNEFYKTFLDKLFKKQPDKKNILENLVRRNIWFEYFMTLDNAKEGWIDFESEICKIIRLLEFIRDEYYEKAKIDSQNIKKPKSLDIFQELFSKCPSLAKFGKGYKQRFGNKTITFYEYSNPKTKLKKIFNKPLYKAYYSGKSFKTWNKVLLDDLTRLIEALEFYLREYVYGINIETYSPDILEILSSENNNKTDIRLLSFNYTNTLEKAYRKNISCSNFESHYLHGKVREENINYNNMVLGIDEYLSRQQRTENIDYLNFQKFFQRIQKKTGNNYLEWLNFDGCKNSKHEVYIFGHSLDVTDKDILKKFILNDQISTTIYYHNQEAYEKLVANLIKIIGSDELIKKVSGTDAAIVFKQQQESIPIPISIDEENEIEIPQVICV